MPTKLIKFALPLAPLEENITTNNNITLDENFSKLPSSNSLAKINVISNVLIKPSVSNITSAKRKLDFFNDRIECVEEPLIKKPRVRTGILNQINATTIGNLTPRKRKFYYINREQQNKISRLKNSLLKSKNTIKTALKLSETNLFKNFSLILRYTLRLYFFLF